MSFLKKICVCLLCLIAFKAGAFSILTKVENLSEDKLSLASYPDYYPFAYGQKNLNLGYDSESVFKMALEKNVPERMSYFLFPYYETVNDVVYDMEDGKVQIFMGAFYSTSSFNELDFVFPAILNSPIHLMMVLSKISEVKQTEDLKKLKGIYVEREAFSDYMLKTFQDLNMTSVETPDEAYEKLIVGDVDFILGSYYYHYAKVLERGLKDYVSFSSRPLWNMPMFFAISKKTEDRKTVHEYFRRLASSDAFHQDLLDIIKEMIKQKEEESVGVVPPMYVRKAQDGELTPADEAKEAEK